MLFLSENLRKYRILKNLTQEDVAKYLNITPQSVSKWERSECYPDIEFLPALANIFETSVDLLLGMDVIRREETLYNIHKRANELQCEENYVEAEKVYRNALLLYPHKSGILLGLAGTLALQGKAEEAVEFMEKGIPICESEKQKATARAVLCFLYLKCERIEKAKNLADTLPHMRESREAIQPLITGTLDDSKINENITKLLLGD